MVDIEIGDKAYNFEPDMPDEATDFVNFRIMGKSPTNEEIARYSYLIMYKFKLKAIRDKSKEIWAYDDNKHIWRLNGANIAEWACGLNPDFSTATTREKVLLKIRTFKPIDREDFEVNHKGYIYHNDIGRRGNIWINLKNGEYSSDDGKMYEWDSNHYFKVVADINYNENAKYDLFKELVTDMFLYKRDLNGRDSRDLEINYSRMFPVIKKGSNWVKEKDWEKGLSILYDSYSDVVREPLLVIRDLLNLQKWFGYHLIVRPFEEIAYFLVGTGGSGKSKTFDCLINVLGESVCSGYKLKDFSSNNTYFIAAVIDRLGNVDDDMRIETPKEFSIWKSMVTGSFMGYRQIYQAAKSGRPIAKFTFLANYFPTLEKEHMEDDAIWRRVRINEAHKGYIKIDKYLISKILENEREGIFSWMLRGRKMLIEDGFDYDEDYTYIKDLWEDHTTPGDNESGHGYEIYKPRRGGRDQNLDDSDLVGFGKEGIDQINKVNKMRYGK